MLLDKKTRLVMIGDSITDCGRDYNAEPAGWGSYGDGYVNLVQAFFTGLMPKQQVMVMNKGISGNRITDLEKRWKKDVESLEPDWVSIMIGINDVWRHFDAVVNQVKQVDEALFRETYEKLIEKTLPNVKGIVVMSPFMIEPNKEDPMRKMTDAYGAIAREVAEKYDLIFVDVQAKMDEFTEALSGYHLSADRVHPNISGHMIIAKAFLDAVEFDR